MNINRRNFVKNLAVGTAAVSISGIVASCMPKGKNPASEKSGLKAGDTILFQGDSITDAGRNREKTWANDPGAFGGGYALLAAAQMLCKYPEKDLQIYNRGISGNKVFQLRERWDEECIGLNPSVLSILIGVNDFWHTLSHGYEGTVKSYEDDFMALLKYTKEKLPNVQLVIGEPFAVNNIKAVDDSWYPAFNDYRAAAKRVAEAYGAIFIPYQTIFDEACKKVQGNYWTYDGVHPSLAGSELMAEAWLQAVGVE